MKKRLFALVLSIIMLITSFIGAMPVSAAKTTTTAAKTTTTTTVKFIVPPDGKQIVVRETKEQLEDGSNILQFLKSSRNEYCIYTGIDEENWHCVVTVYGAKGYVKKGVGKIVNSIPTASTTTLTTTTKASSKKTSTTVKPTTTKSTTKKTATTTTKATSTEPIYLKSAGSKTNIRAEKSIKSAKVESLYVRSETDYDVAVVDKIEKDDNGQVWYHVIFNSKKGWVDAKYVKIVPAPTTKTTTKVTTSTTASTTATTKKTTTTTKATTVKKTTTTKKSATTTTKKPMTTTTATKKSSTTTTTMTKKVITDVFILESGGGKTMVKNKEVRNSTKIKIGIILYSDGSYELSEVKG